VGDLQLHARLAFRDVRWILRDLASTDGTLVNGTKVGRCELRRATSW
jgi:pSer/pThr/pTyr-binding forkhead associated (FHA) protein